MFINKTRYFLLFFIALLTNGCATNAFIQKVTPVNSSLAPYNKALINIKGKSKSIESIRGYEESISDLEMRFISNLSDTKMFDMVSMQTESNTEKGTIIINLLVEELNYLSGAASVMGGVMSGNARFKVLAQLIDAETRKTIGEIRSGAQTSSSGGIFRGSTGTLISGISKKLADEISSYK